MGEGIPKFVPNLTFYERLIDLPLISSCRLNYRFSHITNGELWVIVCRIPYFILSARQPFLFSPYRDFTYFIPCFRLVFR